MAETTAMRYALILTLVGLVSSYTCDPQKDCAEYGAGAKVPDIRDCNKYYFCLTGGGVSPNSFECDANEYFDEATGDCASSSTDCTYPVCENSTTYCELDCYTETYIPVAGNSSLYYICGPGPILAQCEPGLVFDGNKCTIFADQQCETCIVRCDPSLGSYTIINPFNCQEFITCNNGVVGGTYSCGTGMYYDNLQGNCAPGTCTSYCPEERSDFPIVCAIDSQFECPASGGSYPYCLDACVSLHYNCSSPRPSLTMCSQGYVFDYITNECTLLEDCASSV